MKKCTNCKELKNLEEFNKNRRTKDSYEYSCRDCRNIKRVEYRRTKIGLACRIYDTQVQNSKKKVREKPLYTKTELKDWILRHDKFDFLYRVWVFSGYDKTCIPSVDRINDYGIYSFDNIQLMTWEENKAKAHLDMREGRNNKQSKSVLQYTIEGEFVKEYYSIAQAGRESGAYRTNISHCCKGLLNKTGGFKWEYKEKNNRTN